MNTEQLLNQARYQAAMNMARVLLDEGIISGEEYSEIDTIMTDIYKIDLWAFGKAILYRYIMLIVIYAAVTYVVYVVRYRRARRNLRVYYNNLRRLGSMYRKELKEKE